MNNRFRLLLLLCSLMAATQVLNAAEVIHEEKSLYRDINVVQTGSRRCLIFNVHRGDRNQTCVDVDNRDELVFSYTKMSFAGLLLTPEPKAILIAGLGGGTLPLAFNDLFPDALIDVIEVDQAVVNVAKEFFFFEENANMSVAVNDARVFIKRAGILGKKYDYIILDAFGGDYIPEHLLNLEVGKRDLTSFVVTGNMHERKKVMYMNSDAIVVLPGGAGSLDEFFEVLTWRQLGLHDKPIYLLNTKGYWDPLLALLDHVVEQGFAGQETRDSVTVVADTKSLQELLRARFA